MQHRTIEADVLDIKGKLIVIKGDLDQDSLQAIGNSFRRRNADIIGIIALGDSEVTALTKEQAIDMLNKIINKQEIV